MVMIADLCSVCSKILITRWLFDEVFCLYFRMSK